MGTCIEAVATAHSRRGIGRSARRLSDAASRECLERAHRRADEIDLLINAGIYKDKNAAEPALASLIQEDIGANPGHPPHPGRHGTFSFDVMNGGCGVVTALSLVDGFVAQGAARLGLVIAADADPHPATTRGFPFAPVGGALLLGHAEDGAGFERFELQTFPEDAQLFESSLSWVPRAGFARRGRNVIAVHEDAEFRHRCIRHGTHAASAFLESARLDAKHVDLLIASQYPPGFGEAIAANLGVPATRVPSVSKNLAHAHTSGPLVALEAAFEDGSFAHAQTILIVTAGAGITIGCALYRQAARSLS